MPGTRTDYGQMYDHELNPRKGWAGDRGMVLEKTLPIASGMINKVYAGCVLSVVDGRFTLGITSPENATKCAIPFFAFQNEDDPDVNPDLGNIAGGVLMAFCAHAPMELESTEFDAEETYVHGMYLTADEHAGPSNMNARGKLTAGLYGTDVICGQISDVGSNANGSFTNEHGVDMIRFYSVFYPPLPKAG